LEAGVTFVVSKIERPGISGLNPADSTGIRVVPGNEVHRVGKIGPRGRIISRAQLIFLPG